MSKSPKPDPLDRNLLSVMDRLIERFPERADRKLSRLKKRKAQNTRQRAESVVTFEREGEPAR